MPWPRRKIELKFRVTPEEKAAIEGKMAQMGIVNREAYLRKMALDGYIVNLDLPELREMVSLLRRSGNNLNQLAKRVNATDRVYAADMEDIRRWQDALWTAANTIITRLAEFL